MGLLGNSVPFALLAREYTAPGLQRQGQSSQIWSDHLSTVSEGCSRDHYLRQDRLLTERGVFSKIHDGSCEMIPIGNHAFFPFDNAHQPILRDYDSNCLMNGIAKTKD